MKKLGFNWTVERRLTLAASILSVLLSIGYRFSGKAPYDPMLAVLTVTLIALLWYTCFTHEAVELSRQAVELSRETERERKRVVSNVLASVTSDLLALLANLPKKYRDPDVAKRILTASFWEESRVDVLVAYAAQAGVIETMEATNALGALRQLKSWGTRAQKEGQNYDFEKFPFDQWDQNIDRTEKSLRRILTETVKITGQAATISMTS